jgi:Rap1a immunity proteins
MAVIDAMTAMELAGVMKKLSCEPPGVTAGQVKDVVVRYLEKHPESRHAVGASLVLAALYEAFPCSNR